MITDLIVTTSESQKCVLSTSGGYLKTAAVAWYAFFRSGNVFVLLLAAERTKRW